MSVLRLPAPAPRRPPTDDLASYFPPFHLEPTNALGLSSGSSDTDSPLASSESDFSSNPSSSSTAYSYTDDLPSSNKVTLALANLPAKTDRPPQGPRTPSRIDPNNPPWPAYRGYHTFSFAHATMGVRLPTILGKAIDDTVRTLNSEWDDARIEDLAECIERMDVLMEDLSGNSKLRPIVDDGEGDVALWNKEIARFFEGKDFMNAPWLFAEAYKYRRLHECFSTSRYWKSYDPFFRQKCESFARSGDAVRELATRFATLEPFSPSVEEQERKVFMELAQDLSLLLNTTEEDIRNLQGTGEAKLAETEKNIIGNHLAQLWETLSAPGVKGGRVDIVLDNAGFELYCDFVFADYLIQSGLASQVRFHGKRLPWFVSDVTRKDWNWLLNGMAHGMLFGSEADMEPLREMGRRWKGYEREGLWAYEQHPFWCTGYTFWDLPTEAPDLFLHLSQSALVFFKGDLNHRKLTYDCAAPSTTPFEQAIGPMASWSGAPRVCSIRTVKSDVVVGLPNEEIAERLDREEPGWKISGKYAVVLLSEGRPGENVRFT